MKKFLKVIIIALLLFINTMKAQQSWLTNDKTTFYQDHDHYLIKSTLLKDSLISRKVNKEEMKTKSYKVFSFKKITLIPKDLQGLSDLELNDAIKENESFYIKGNNNYKKIPFSQSIWYPHVYLKKYLFKENKFYQIDYLFGAGCFTYILINVIIISFFFRCIYIIYSIKLRRKINLGQVTMSHLLITLISIFFHPKTLPLNSIFNWINIPNLLCIIICIIWLIYQKRKISNK